MKGKKCKCVEDVCNKCIKKTRKRNRKVKPAIVSELRFSPPVQPIQLPQNFINSKASESNELISLIKSLLDKSKSKQTEEQTQTDAQDIFNEYSGVPIETQTDAPDIFNKYSEPVKMKAPNVPGNYFVKSNPKIRIFSDETDDPIYVEAEPEPIFFEETYDPIFVEAKQEPMKPPDFKKVIDEANEDALLKGFEASKKQNEEEKEQRRLAKEERKLKAENEIREREKASKLKEAELLLKRKKMDEEATRLRETLLKFQMKQYDEANVYSKPLVKGDTILKRNKKRDLYEAESIAKLDALNQLELKAELNRLNKLNKSKSKNFNI